jgi:hypothetical protein
MSRALSAGSTHDAHDRNSSRRAVPRRIVLKQHNCFPFFLLLYLFATAAAASADGHAELAPQNFGGPSPRTTPPLAPQIKSQNRGFLNFGSFSVACCALLAAAGGWVRAHGRSSSPHQLHAIRHWLHFSASQIQQLLFIHSADCQMCELSVYFVLTRAEFDTHSRDDRNSQQHTASRLMIA